MKKSKLIKIVSITAVSILVLFTVLIVHIAMVTNPKGKPHYGVQLARIDFKTAPSAAQASEISDYLKTINGVGSVMYNAEHNNIVYAYQTETTNGQEVFDQLMAAKQINATPFVFTEEMMASTAQCPVMNNESIMMKLAHKIQLYFL